ncbi:MAG: hypothetical protein AB1801_18105 [Chloroflexota bacterium]
MRPEKSSEIAPGSKEIDLKIGRQVIRGIGAAIGLLIAGPVLAVLLTSLLTMLILCGCMAMLAVAYPFAQDEMRAARETAVSHRQATATAGAQIAVLQATATAYPLPAQVQMFVPFEDLVQWDFSADGEYAVLVSPEHVRIVQLATRQMRSVELSGFSDRSLRYGGAVWLEARRLLVYQVRDDNMPQGYRQIEVQGDSGFELQESDVQAIRGSQISRHQLEGQEIIRLKDVNHNLAAAVINGTAVTVIIADGLAEQQAVATLIEDMVVREATPDMAWQALDPYASTYKTFSSWRTLERYPSPGGYFYAAIWPEAARLAILRSGGEIVIETQASEFGPTGATCRLIPLGWLPNSSGVLFHSRCRDAQGTAALSNQALLLLPIPDP